MNMQATRITRKALSIIAILLGLMMPDLASAGEACCPTHDAASPAANMVAAMPPTPGSPGTPGIPAGQALPEGHPPLPQGHPQMGNHGMSSAIGTLVVKAAQGTPNGTTISGAKAVVRFYQRGTILDQREIELDQYGVAMIEDVKLTTTVNPVVTIQHAGTTFEVIGQPMSPNKPEQIVRIAVYDTTDTQPEWKIAMRHVMVRRVEEGLYVSEVLSVQSSGDRAWKGVPDAHAQPEGENLVKESNGLQTLVISLPAHAQHVQLGQGFQATAARFAAGKIISGAPLTPGETQYRFAYLLPTGDGSHVLTFPAPAFTRQMMVFTPVQGLVGEPTGLSEGRAMGDGPMAVTVYEARELKVGQNVSLKLKADGNAATGNAQSAVPPAAAPATANVANPPAEASSSNMLVGVVVAGALIGSIFVLTHKPAHTAA